MRIQRVLAVAVVFLFLNAREWLNNTGHNQFVDQDLETVCKCLTP